MTAQAIPTPLQRRSRASERTGDGALGLSDEWLADRLAGDGPQAVTWRRWLSRVAQLGFMDPAQLPPTAVGKL
jgi:hypothetical protein